MLTPCERRELKKLSVKLVRVWEGPGRVPSTVIVLGGQSWTLHRFAEGEFLVSGPAAELAALTIRVTCRLEGWQDDVPAVARKK